MFNNATTKGITTLDAGTGLLTTTSANIGGWLISDATGISKTASSGTIKLDATNAQITVSGYLTYTAGIAAPITASATDVVVWAGASKAAPSFKVTADGTLSATSYLLSGANGDYWKSDGSFQFGGSNGISRSTGTGTINFGSAISVPSANITGTITANAIVANASITAPIISGGTFSAINSSGGVTLGITNISGVPTIDLYSSSSYKVGSLYTISGGYGMTWSNLQSGTYGATINLGQSNAK